MPSPFPGMNPYLEQDSIRRDFHKSLIVGIRDELARQVTPKYFVRIGETRYPQQPAVPEPELIPFLEIVSIRERKSVTLIEILRPSNKSFGSDREFFVKRRSRLLGKNSTHYIEIDLLRGEPRMRTRVSPPHDYSILLSRFERRYEVEFWPIQLPDSLPTVPVPLFPGDGGTKLDLKGVLDRVYDAARYESYIYRGQPEPALSTADDEWAKQFVPVHS